jgi:hypothetical protein
MATPETAQWIGTAGDPIDGDWTDAAEWTNGSGSALGSVPGVDDAVVLQDGTVTFDTTDEIYSISGGVLDMTGGSLTIDDTSTGTNTIDVGTGASLTAAGGASIELTGSIDGALAGAGGFVLDSGTTIGSGADLTASSFTFNGAAVTSSLTYTGSGLTLNSASVTDGATFTITAEDTAIPYDGSIGVSDSATLVLDTDQTGTGVITLASFGTADIDNFANGTIVFLDGRGDLELQQPTSFTGSIAGFQPGDQIDLVTSSVVTRVSFTPDPNDPPSGGILTAFDGATVVASLQLEGNYTTGFTFGFTAVANGYDIEVTTAACYRRGTRIQTAHGETPIEQLAIGDAVMTHTGAHKPIRWIGRRSYAGDFAWGNRDVLPILIRQGALGEAVPARDLWVSPEHAMYIDGMLIPAALLVNGESIVQEQRVDEVTYFHLEFDTHELIVAEGAVAESFVDDESRERFDNAAEYHELYPHSTSQPTRFCAQRVEDGYELEVVRARLAARVNATGWAAHWPNARNPGAVDALIC